MFFSLVNSHFTYVLGAQTWSGLTYQGTPLVNMILSSPSAPAAVGEIMDCSNQLRRGDVAKEKMLLGGNKVGDGKFKKTPERGLAHPFVESSKISKVLTSKDSNQ